MSSNTEIEGNMLKSIESLKREYAKLRAGRAHISLLDGIKVDYYGTPTPISQVASLSVPEARTITVQPWESSIIKNIERAIQKSDLDINPTNDGKVIRLALPAMTEERRKLLVKKVGKLAEDCKVSIRNIRREANDSVKKQEKDKEISKDVCHSIAEENQKITDKFIVEVNEVMHRKEKDVMSI